MFINEVRIQGLKEQDRSLTLAPLTFIVGPNGAGKTAVLDAIRLVATGTTDGVPDTIEGVSRYMSDDTMRVAVQWDDGTQFLRQWKASGKKREQIGAVEATGTQKAGDEARVMIESRMGVGFNLSFGASKFVEMSGDKRRLAVLKAIKIDGVSRADLDQELQHLADAARRKADLNNSDLSRDHLLWLQDDVVSVALAWSAEVHQRALAARQNRKAAEGAWEGVALVADAVSGQMVGEQRKRVEDLREQCAQLREQLAREQEQDRQAERLARLPKGISKEEGNARLAKVGLLLEAEDIGAQRVRLKTSEDQEADGRGIVRERRRALEVAEAMATSARGGVCQTCGQTIGQDKLADAEEEVSLAQAALVAAEDTAAARRFALVCEQGALASMLDVAEAQKVERQAILAEMQQRVIYDAAINTVAQAIENMTRDTDETIKRVSATHADLALAEKRLQELERQRAAAELRIQAEKTLATARAIETYWDEIDAGLGPRGLLGRMLRTVSGKLSDAMREVSSRPIEVELVDAAGKDTFAVGLRRKDKLIDVRALSGAERGEVMAATALALEVLRGAPWKAVIADDMDRLDERSQIAFMGRLHEAKEQGMIDQAILAGHVCWSVPTASWSWKQLQM